jgi:hypothetical protein
LLAPLRLVDLYKRFGLAPANKGFHSFYTANGSAVLESAVKRALKTDTSRTVGFGLYDEGFDFALY